MQYLRPTLVARVFVEVPYSNYKDTEVVQWQLNALRYLDKLILL